ncbi:MAG TPA: TlyA family rRNA (cytidine-2'-O)-methyltransferase [Bdellovibrionales bacterium]|nr:TlyA family rRNA (cytidine-2'-O)-methyltransferase [Bdellovibrionales bacterium]|tara:strand:- start:2290 stop:3054 length:765 start_codon:yes stop_codon:yes gene_type:complete
MKRADILLTEKGLCPSRTKAKELIEIGEVEYLFQGEWKKVSTSSQKLPEDVELKILDSERLRFVSRAGLKLEGALNDFNISVQDRYVLDIGQSTGGFTDCLLQQGAKEVLGFDVGHDQLHKSLKNHPQIKAYEGIHLQDLASITEIKSWLDQHLDLVVVDISFISVISAFEELCQFHGKKFEVLALVKPQFEVGRENLNRSGVVKDRKVQDQVLKNLKLKIEELGFEVSEFKASKLAGRDGNQEFFLFCKHSNR